VLLLGFHIANEIVRRASLLAHGDSSYVSAVLRYSWKYCSSLNGCLPAVVAHDKASV
jgi:hypothetical protein